ncbi:MAG: HlyD family efflux transporter periplasmic adaptor subunit [Pirellulaceae bacterium]
MMNDNLWKNALCVMLLASIGGITFAHAAAAQDSAGDIEVQECVVQFAKEVDVPALESGLVAEVHVTTNQSVVTGGPVLRLGDETLIIRRAAAQTRLESAIKEAESTIELDFAKAALEESEAELDLNRRIEKENGGAISRERVRQLSLSFERAKLEVARAYQRIDQSLVAVKLQQSEIAVLDDQLRRLHADSPLSGIVLDVGKSKGEWVEQGQSVATIARIDRLHVHAFIRGNQISPSDCVGLPVSVLWQDSTTSAERKLSGEVISVDPQRLPGSRFRIHAEVINQCEQANKNHWQLNPGADVRMVVHTGSIAKRIGGTSTR